MPSGKACLLTVPLARPRKNSSRGVYPNFILIFIASRRFIHPGVPFEPPISRITVSGKLGCLLVSGQADDKLAGRWLIAAAHSTVFAADALRTSQSPYLLIIQRIIRAGLAGVLFHPSF